MNSKWPATILANSLIRNRTYIPARLRVMACGTQTRAALLATCLAALTATPAHGAQLNLAQSPLFIQNAVQPNIFFMLDDSGSMDWETLYNDGTGLDNSGGTTLDFTPDNDTERLRMCPGYNTLAYDPNVRYTPWKGSDDAGSAYVDADLMHTGSSTYTQIRRNPYCSAVTGTGLCSTNSGTANATDTAQFSYAYFPWSDANGNGQYDTGECDITNPGGVTWTELATTGTTNVPAADQQRNYVNWYSYYRKREYVLKRAVTELVYNSRERMGMSTLHRNNNVGVRIENVDDISVPVDTAAAANKSALLGHLSRINSTGGTPLRTALDNVGKYFEGVSQTALFGVAPAHTGTVDPDSPVLNNATGGSCQQNFVILMTDGYYNSGYTGTNVGNADGNASSKFDSGNSGAAARPYGDNQSNTLGDIAMYYYERDLFSTLPNKVPYTAGYDPKTPGTDTPGDTTTDDIVDNDPAHTDSGVLMHQHMVTYTVAFGLSGDLDPFKKTTSACDSDPTDACWSTNIYGGWPNQTPTTMEDSPAAVDDLWHAAYNGRGQFLSAKSPDTLISALEKAIEDITGRQGTAAAVAASTSSVSTATRLYLVQFDSGTWRGSLIAKKFDPTTGDPVDTNDWGASPSDAGEALKNQASRQIVTWNGTAGVAFQWTSLTSGAGSQQEALKKNPSTGTIESDAIGQERLAYLRGDHSKEQDATPPGSYRSRADDYVLGDIVNSAAVYIAAPKAFYPDSLESAPWSAFRAAYINRKPMLYVGANDGMLHGFAACISASAAGCTSADLGTEKIAYVPGAVFPRLNRLTDPQYTHTYYVDGTPTVGDVFYGGSWHTVLVGSLRAGGQAIFALDVTDPTTFSEGNASSIARWEFTHPDLGYTFSQPFIAKMNNGQWAAIFGNGYNNSEADGSASATGQASLFVVNIADGTLITKISTGVGTVAAPNGLATPKVIDSNGDSRADFVYAGDLLGNMWKFDLRSSTPSSWTASKLFTATDPGNNPQPVTSKADVTLHPGGQGGYMVYFGTGKYLEGGGADIGSTQTQTFYGIWDAVGSGGAATLVATNKLQSQTISEPQAGRRTLTSNPISAWGTGAGQFMGWKVNLPTSGERVIFTPQYISDNRILFVTTIPSSDPCSYGGSAWLMQLNATTGGSPTVPVFDVDGDGEFTTADNVGGNVVGGVSLGTGIAPQPVVLDTSNGRVILTPDSSGKIQKEKTDSGLGKGRQSWRQLQ